MPSGDDAVTVISHWPLVSSNGVLNVLSDPTGTVVGGGADGVAAGTGVAFAPPGAGVAFDGVGVDFDGGGVDFDGAGVAPAPGPGPRYVALTTTWLAFVAVPLTGIAPFS